ncbi:hypothetical protein SCHPADRAFT_868482 [Schizopora paradoxa]|uniref:N-acetyltransferase domain-containing protein n=1 Tax=Schizopora paradoxa TaxID=27342 RepID=A0A0H2RYP5_9AGAM|nr:hypothetical protein SCHPADRAFT_868482 [Schizopora paradoxa]
MSFFNNFKPPVPDQENELYGQDPYDINCAIPLNFAALENDRIKLTPVIPRIHAQEVFDQLQEHPEIHHHLPFAFPNTLEDVCVWFRDRFQKIPGHIHFAVHDKTRPSRKYDLAISGGGSFAGTIALISTSLPNLSTEVGFMIFHSFQRTHVFPNAAGLLITHCLNLPSDPVSPGLGFRRVQWFANSDNIRSIKAGEKLGFRQEGMLRWHSVLPEGKEGIKPREGDPAGQEHLGRHSNVRSIKAAERLGFHMEGTIRWHRALPEGSEGMKPREDDPRGQCPGRHTAILSICWDDWVSGVKEKVKTVMDRK